jgi:hypothetical protein
MPKIRFLLMRSRSTKVNDIFYEVYSTGVQVLVLQSYKSYFAAHDLDDVLAGGLGEYVRWLLAGWNVLDGD